MVPLALPAAKFFPLSTPKDSRRLGRGAITHPGRLSLGLAPETPPRRKRRPSYSHDDYKVMTPVPGSGPAGKERSSESRRGQSEQKKSTSSVKTPSAVERTQVKGQMLQPGRLADSVSRSCPLGYECSRYHDSLAVPAAFRRNSSLQPALRDNDF